MRNLLLLFTIVILAGCRDGVTGISHLEAFADRYSGGHRNEILTGQKAEPQDTVVYMTAVEFPEGYDWHRDSSFGEVPGRIVLYRDSIRILEIPAGPGCLAGTEPDLHHLVDGHVYTESCTDDATIIGCDGEILFSYPVRELLCGLLVEGKDIYTLGNSRSGRGFSLRRNGEELFSRPVGGIAAQISSRPDYLTGALYRDGGHMYFSYWEPLGDKKIWYIVEDGVETRVEVPDEQVYDIRVKGGVLGFKFVKSSPLGVYTYAEDSWKCVVVVSRAGHISLYTPLWPTSRFLSDAVFFPSFRNACVFGERLYLAMNPLADVRKPFLWRNEKILFSLDMNGFLTEVSVVAEQRPAAEDK